MSVLLVTGTSTDVGKTVVTAALAATATAEGRSVAVCKPAQTGVAPSEPGDLAAIEQLAGPLVTRELARYPEPLAPDTAARRARRPLLTLAETAAAVRDLDSADLTLVEGAGGLLVRIGEFTLLDLAGELDAPVLVVTAARLGTLNHTELTVRALATAGVRCAGLVIGAWPADPDLAAACNREDLTRVTGADIVGVVPGGVGSWDRDRFTAAAPEWFAPAWVRGELAAELSGR